MDKNQDNEIQKLFEQEFPHNMDAPASLEDDIMNDIAATETKLGDALEIQGVWVFAGLAVALVLVSLFSSFYYPEYALLIQVKVILASSLAIFGLYQLVMWLPAVVDRCTNKA